MRNLRASPVLLKGLPHPLFFSHEAKRTNRPKVRSAAAARASPGPGSGRKRMSPPVVVWCSAAGEVGVSGRGSPGLDDKYLVREFGWAVRRMAKVGEEMRKVAHVQAEAFHTPVALLDDFFFDFFKAEVLSALSYRVRNSPPERYACLVAESDSNQKNSLWEPLKEIVGVVDVSAQRDEDVLIHIDGEKEYLYVSGIAVLSKFRRQKVATALLKASDALSKLWGFSYLALRAYEDDLGARELYSNAGYKVVSRDPIWTTWIGKKRRVLMVKRSSI